MSKARYKSITGREQKRDADVLCYQIRQSFPPGELDPEEALNIGYELAMRWTTQIIFQLRHPNYPDKDFYRGALIFSFALLMLASIWMAINHRYELDKKQRQKNVNIELGYCCVQTLMALLTIRFGMGLVGLILILSKDGEIISGYPDANNHLIDGTRYALERVYRRRCATA